MAIKDIVARIETRLAKTGLSAAAASVAAGLSNSAIRNLQRRAADVPDGSARAVTIDRLAMALGTTSEWLMHGRGPEDGDNFMTIGDAGIARLPLLGKIQAGLWLETSLLHHQDSEVEMVPVARDPRFPHAKQYCLQVVGDSMNKDYPDQSYVHCVDFADSGLPLKAGRTVHVERQRAGGQLVEITLKRVEVVKGEMCLVPRSTNPAYKPFPLKSLDADTEVFVKGVVIGRYQREELW